MMNKFLNIPFFRVYCVLFVFGMLLFFIQCQEETTNKIIATDTYLNLADSVQYMGMNTCRSCHNNVYKTFIHTGMGKSFDHASKEKSDAEYGQHIAVYDKKSNFYYKPFFEKDSLYIMEFRLENGDTVHQRIERMSYIVGSGQHTNSHILDINGYIYQAPITFYTQDQRWDLAPGFEEKNQRFDRFLTTECITCHNHFPDFEVGSLNKFNTMPSGIECERCHGPGEIHVKEMLAGNTVDTAQAIDYTIVNPRDLSRDLQMDLCQRCHLQGLAVLNEHKTFFDFKPGMRLNEVMNVFLPRYNDSHEKFIMASQADRLRLSECYQNSEMTCLTCHNPHQSVTVTDKTHYQKICQNCHQEEGQLCTAEMSLRQAENDNCTTCHMPPSGSIDIPHVRITDHAIKIPFTPQAKITTAEEAKSLDFLGLEILTKDKGEAIDMARGYIAMYDKYVQAPSILDSAYYYLNASPLPFEKKFTTLVHYYFAKEDYENILKQSEKFSIEKIQDAWTAYRIGEAFYKYQNYTEALRYLKKATDFMPYNLDFQEKLGSTYVGLQQIAPAQKVFEFVLKENPKRKIALSNLGYLLVIQGKIEAGKALYERAIALDPDYEQVLINKAAVLLYEKNVPAAKSLLERILRINPDNIQAQTILQQI